ncbi:energy-coupling factor transporter transmembrane protein EcfT [Bacillus luteolus]|uniref:Energy-coupling factor transporter transmembrane protein EcfT n=1 Tax=Litchfieldia luteola TaxID=682179 RepID=A0ABR9QF65_9BACI|nr:energy-coupling factor transporter transmembrane component T [Cytobacillus luteolus]MBE4907135.1 energy-coupling factor transporter transmembrane protein EcfT [Cytobacillus luteolus]MBP1943395.1 energy-coupling factor transport system permease protein [Cytobacillus luteolus]
MEHRFEQFHPTVIFLYYVGALSLLMLMLHPLFLAGGFIIVLLINVVQGHVEGLKRWGFLMLSMFVFILILTPLFNERGRHVLFEIGTHRVTLEAVTYGAMTAISIISVISLFISYNEVLTPNKLLFLFSKFLPQFAILLMLTLRFIPLMRRRLAEISAVQSSKGISVLHGHFKDKAKNGLLYVQVLLTYSLEEAIQTADSMKARGYGSGKRSTYEHFYFKKADRFAIAFLVSIFIIIFFWRLHSGYGFLTIYPRMERFQLSDLEMLSLVGYLIFVSFPLLVKGWGYVRWRILN